MRINSWRVWAVCSMAALGLATSSCGEAGGNPGDGALPPDASAALDAVPFDAPLIPADFQTLPDLSSPPDQAVAGDGGVYVCYGAGNSFPAFDRGCTNSVSCSIGIHQIDCCGTHIAVGFNHAYRAAFDQDEAAFRVVCPANCKCVARPTLCDDGKTAPDNQVTVSCDNGKCTTHGQ